MSRPDAPYAITPHLLLRAYSIGLFPMAESAEDDQLFWVDPKSARSFRSTPSSSRARWPRPCGPIGSRSSSITDFDAVIDACAASAPDREKTWINAEIRRLYRELFDMGFAHTVECRREGRLVGGLYGVALRGAFFGESMFHRERDASKVALDASDRAAAGRAASSCSTRSS